MFQLLKWHVSTAEMACFECPWRKFCFGKFTAFYLMAFFSAFDGMCA
jgi:hypothetical protein